MFRSRILFLLSIVAVPVGPVVAQSSDQPAPVSSTPAAAQPAPAGIPALTPVKVEILAELGSRTSKSGDTFALQLAEPILVDGAILLPAGTAGMGEVVHAKKSGASGSSGELVLAARYLEVNGRQLRLRSMHLSRVGSDNYGTAVAVGVAVGLPGLFVRGRNVVIPVGAIAEAKTAESFVLDQLQAAAPAVDGNGSTENPSGENANAHP